MEVKIRFTSSKRLPPDVDSLLLGKYSIEPIPEPFDSNLTATGTYLLRFDDQYREGETSSNPFKEAALFFSLVSLAWDAELDVHGTMVNSVLVPSDIVASGIKPSPTIMKTSPDITEHLDAVKRLDPSTAKQFLRACEVFSAALHNTYQNPTLSFFLLSIAVECMANSVSAGSGPRERFLAFLTGNSADFTPSIPTEDFASLLREAYDRHRSGFTHGGKEIPHAAVLADRLGRPYVKNIVDGKEVRTPGLRWFQALVRHSLLHFLHAAASGEAPPVDHLKNVSMDAGAVSLKFKRSLERGSVVTVDDVDLD
jgi:hypothetical protein